MLADRWKSVLHERTRCAVRRSRGARIALLAALLLTWASGAADADGARLIWMWRKDVASKQMRWLQVRPTGHAWMLVRSENEAASAPRVRTTLEIAFKIPAESYARARSSLASIGLQSGQHAENDEFAFGIDAPPARPTFLLEEPEGARWGDRTATRRLAQELEALVWIQGIDSSAILRELAAVMRSAAAACVIAPSARVSLLTTRGKLGEFQAPTAEGDACLSAAGSRHLATLRWPPAVAQVSVRSTLDGVAASVRIAYDGRVPLYVDGHNIDEVVSDRTDAGASRAHERRAEGVWHEHVAIFRSDPDGGETCRVSLEGRCVPTPGQDVAATHAGLLSLFSSLADPAGQALAPAAPYCREHDPMEQLGLHMKSSRQEPRQPRSLPSTHKHPTISK